MQSDERNFLLKEFEKEIWLYLDNDLSEERMKYWEENIIENPELLKFLNETKSVLNLYDETLLSDIENDRFERMLHKATSRMPFINRLKSFLSNSREERKTQESITPKLAFGGLIVIAALILLLLSDKPNPVKVIGAEMLDWNAEEISTQIGDIHNSISIIKDDRMRQYILYKKTQDEWSRNIYTMEQQIKKLNDETDEVSM